MSEFRNAVATPRRRAKKHNLTAIFSEEIIAARGLLAIRKFGVPALAGGTVQIFQRNRNPRASPAKAGTPNLVRTPIFTVICTISHRQNGPETISPFIRQ
jgi:hypothetical protein